MSGDRELPEQASLRYLKLEAKRRVADGEFPALHQAQLAIAREHGQPSWAALRTAVAGRDGTAGHGGHALAQLRWIVARFSDAGTPGWTAPGDDELRAHFTEQFLAELPPDRVVGMITQVAAELPEFTVLADTPFIAQGRLAGLLITVTTERRRPYRLSGMRIQQLGERIKDPRAASPGTTTSGAVPAAIPAFAAAAVTQFGLVGLALAGGTREVASGVGLSGRQQRAGERGTGEIWSTATGWADLERAEPLQTGHAFPAHYLTHVVTTLAVLRLAGDGRLRLDDPANKYLASIRFADDQVTIRQLLVHTSGVSEKPPVHDGPPVPGLAEVTGPVLDCSGRRGVFRPSHTGSAALGEVIADLTGEPYPDAAARLVLEPLGMRDSWFPDRWPDRVAPGHRLVVTGYDVAADRIFTPAGGPSCAFQAAGWLWTTAADLVRLGLGWWSLLPRSLAAQVLRPHAAQPNGVPVGLGWAVNEELGIAGIVGEGPGASASLLISLDGRRAAAAATSRQAQLEPVTANVLRTTAGLDPSMWPPG